MEMVFNLCFMHNVYATIVYNGFNGWNNNHARNMKSSSSGRCRVGC